MYNYFKLIKATFYCIHQNELLFFTFQNKDTFHFYIFVLELFSMQRYFFIFY
jgi:hypothetical protein